SERLVERGVEGIEVDAGVFAVGGGVFVGAGGGEAEVFAAEVGEADLFERSREEVVLWIERSPLRGDDDVVLKDGAGEVIGQGRIAHTFGRGDAVVVVGDDVVLKDQARGRRAIGTDDVAGV